MCHFVKVRNLPYSVDDVKAMTRACKICAACKPRFYRPPESHLIKATQPFERLNLDFKGPLPSNKKNIYFLQVIDEFSRYPFVYPCNNMEASTIIKCLTDLFSIFGMPMYVHSDRGSSLMSVELKQFLTLKGVSTSRTTPYNPQGNGLVEKSNGTIWRAVTMELQTHGLPQSLWQEVLPNVLHSIRTLLCTATNVTPHERLLGFPRRSGTGTSLPTWLATPGPVLLRKYVRRSKQDPLVDEVELIEANTNYAHVRHANGREDTVSIRDLAPFGEVSIEGEVRVGNGNDPTLLESQSEVGSEVSVPAASGQAAPTDEPLVVSSGETQKPLPSSPGVVAKATSPPNVRSKTFYATKVNVSPEVTPRRSTRETKVPERFGDYTTPKKK